VYFTGGNRAMEKSSRECLMLDLRTNQMFKKQKLNQRRYGHGICFLRNFIYVTGGVDNNDLAHEVVERYDIMKNHWEVIKPLPNPMFSMTLLVMRNRYIYMFGGIEVPNIHDNCEHVHRLDTDLIGKTSE